MNRTPKLLLGLAICLVASAGAVAQGTVNFCNRYFGMEGAVDAPFFDLDLGVPVPLNHEYLAQLFAGPGDTISLAPVGVPVAFSDGSDSGYFYGGTVVVPGVPEGGWASVKVWAWEAAKGQTLGDAWAAGSKVFRTNVMPIVTGGEHLVPPRPPAVLQGLQVIYLIPEPSSVALLVVGGAVLLLGTTRRR